MSRVSKVPPRGGTNNEETGVITTLVRLVCVSGMREGVKFGQDTQKCFMDVTNVLFFDLGGGYRVLPL